MSIAYPFTAIVGQDDMKRALTIAAVDPGIGGVLVLGERGTGKSTTIRALAALLPKIDVVSGCSYQCDPLASRPGLCAQCGKPSDAPDAKAVTIPVVDLPLGSTEDRVVGALDIERALVNGEKAFQPGLLAQANRGFLYVDEVNLLEDHIVDALLDVAASGENVVEREGLSVRRPAQFVLVGSGNPEEGELRPQLQDRFGLSVDVRTPGDVPTRVEIIRLREAFDLDRTAFRKKWARKESALRRKIQSAREQLDNVDTPAVLLETAAKLCLALGTDGLRGELTLVRSARALAALEGKSAATLKHLRYIGLGLTEAGLVANNASISDLAELLHACSVQSSDHFISVINTDNVPFNGDLVRSLVRTCDVAQGYGTAFGAFLERRVVFHNSMVDRITSHRVGDPDVPRAEPLPEKALVIEDLGGVLPEALGAVRGVVVRTAVGRLGVDIALKLRIANATHSANA